MQLIEKQLQAHQEIVQQLYPMVEQVEAIAEKLLKAVLKNRTIFWCGNGGSAADAQHLAAELVGRFQKNRRAIPSIALTTDTSILTAISNDFSFDEIFKRQLEALCRTGDVVVGLSTSGNSANVNQAIAWANQHNAHTIGLTGKDGGKLKTLAHDCLIVPSVNTARIQEVHILIGHILCQWVEEGL